MLRNFSIISILIILMAGCSSTPTGPSFSSASLPVAPNGFATLVIYRMYAEPTAFSATVKVDGNKITSLSNGTFTTTNVAVGSHTLNAIWPALSGQADSFLAFTVEPGKVYYIELVGRTSLAGIDGNHMVFAIGSGANQLNPDVAIPRVSACCKFTR